MFANMLSLVGLVSLGLIVTPACAPNTRGGGGGAGGDATGSNGSNGSNGSGSNTDDCSADAKLIYTIDDTNHVAQFDATTKRFISLGILNCHPPDMGEKPFSMAVDRQANLYVLFHNGTPLTPGFNKSDVYRVDSQTLACTHTPWVTKLNEDAFGMGFSTNVSGGDTDTLFIAGAADSGGGTQTTAVTLASVDVVTMAPTRMGTVQGQPELTGTGDAKLWGFFPNDGKVQELDKSTGATIGAPLSNASIKTPMPGAWAFAFYGGDFFVFLASQDDVTNGGSTTVHQVDGATGADKGATTTPGGTHIVGAGVSTCAPLVIM